MRMPQPLATDTPAHVEAEVLAALRALSAAQKLALARDMNRMADRLALAGILRRRPEIGLHEQGYTLALQRLAPEQRCHGSALLEGLPLMPTPVDPLALALRLAAILDARAISYVIVGSVAAVVHGEYRTTRDLDVVLNLAPSDVRALVNALQVDFTFLPDDVIDALRQIPVARTDPKQRASFCAYDKGTGFQIDIYLSSGRPFELVQFQRAQTIDIPGEPGGTLRVASAEDTVLAKLEWYQMAPSDRQWRDVQAILHVQGDSIEVAYLRQWANEIGVTILLEWALKGQPPPQSGEQPRQQRLL